MISAANHVPLTPLSFLTRARRAFLTKVAVIDTDETPVSYAELGRDCDALADALRADGVQPGDRVAVLDLNTRWSNPPQCCSMPRVTGTRAWRTSRSRFP
jgi:acyl-CoA synthetase (AMP-forming)/AMP-acid ligase II